MITKKDLMDLRESMKGYSNSDHLLEKMKQTFLAGEIMSIAIIKASIIGQFTDFIEKFNTLLKDYDDFIETVIEIRNKAITLMNNKGEN